MSWHEVLVVSEPPGELEALRGCGLQIQAHRFAHFVTIITAVSWVLARHPTAFPAEPGRGASDAPLP